MKITYIGHACFRIEAQNGTAVITDPYDRSVGIDMIPLCADMITMSHEHHDHSETAMIGGAPVILHGCDAACVGGVTAQAAASFHDDVQGAKRGLNAIRIFAADGLKIVHMGDQGCMPDAAALAAISGADVMLIPVGGTYTVDAQGAKAIIDAAKPRCVIPMHVKTVRCGYPIDTVLPFLDAMGAGRPEPQDALVLAAGGVPEGLVLLQPQADRLW